jgi:hypothetical protein
VFFSKLILLYLLLVIVPILTGNIEQFKAHEGGILFWLIGPTVFNVSRSVHHLDETKFLMI